MNEDRILMIVMFFQFIELIILIILSIHIYDLKERISSPIVRKKRIKSLENAPLVKWANPNTKKIKPKVHDDEALFERERNE